MSTPYENKPVGGLVCASGATTCFAVDFASRVAITKLTVIQTDGTHAAFTVDLFSNADGCAGTATTDADGNAIGDDCYRVCAQQSGTVVDGVGTLVHFFSPEVVFYNQDDVTHIGQKRKIYVRIDPSGAGDTTYSVVIGGTSDI
jgi:hypothetical protein